jgi:hypothetical protein
MWVMTPVVKTTAFAQKVVQGKVLASYEKTFLFAMWVMTSLYEHRWVMRPLIQAAVTHNEGGVLGMQWRESTVC